MSHNPSGWTPRRRTAIFAALGLALACLLAAVQLGVIPSLHDPFFGDGTDAVVNSPLSRSIPIPDALLGALGYAAELCFLFVGGEDRWWRKPWAALLSGLVGLALGTASLVLTILQPVVVHAWCTPCLLIALFIFLGLQSVIGELAATWQLLLDRSHETFELGWRVLWRGEPELPHSLTREPPAGRIRWSWPLISCFLLGVLLEFLPWICRIHAPGRVTIYLMGPLAMASSILAAVEGFRDLRYITSFAGFVMVCWFLGHISGVDRWAVGTAGFFLCVTATAGHLGRIVHEI